MINGTDIIIIDEFSLLEHSVFIEIDELVREMADRKDLQNMSFGGNYVILIGDPAQLPAISKDNLNTYPWKRFSIIILDDLK